MKSSKQIAPIKVKLILAFLLAITGISTFLGVTNYNAGLTLQNTNHLQNALKLMVQLEELLNDVRDLENNEKAYLLNKNQAYLTMMSNARVRIESNLQLLNESVKSIDKVKSKITNLNTKIETRLKQHQIIIQKTQKSLRLVLPDEIANQNEMLSFSIETSIIEMENDGRSILNAANYQLSLSAQKTLNLLMIFSALLLVFLSIVFYMINLDFSKRIRIEAENSQQAELILGLYNDAPCGYHSIDEKGIVQRMNETELKWLGYKREEIIGIKNFIDLITPESAFAFKDRFNQFKKEGILKDAEYEMLRKDGTTFPVLLNASAIYNDDGQFRMSRSMLIDLSDIKRSEERISALNIQINQSTNAIIATDLQFKVTNWNYGAEILYEIRAADAIGKLIFELNITRWDETMVDNALKKLMEGGNWIGEFTRTNSKGEIFHILNSTTIVKDSNGIPTGVISIAQDLTKQKTLEEKLITFNRNLESEIINKSKEISRIFDRVSDAFVALDNSWNYTYVNDLGALPTGKNRSELIGKNIWKMLPEEHSSQLKALYEKAMKSQYPTHVEIYNSATKQWFNKHFYPSSDGLSVFFQEITERKYQESLLSTSEMKYRLLFDNNPLPMWVYSLDTLQFLDVNEAALLHYGYKREEFLAMTILQIRVPADKQKLFDYFKHFNPANSLPQIWKHRKKNGQIIDVNIFSHDIPFGFSNARLVLSNDITEQVKAQADFQQSHEQLSLLTKHLETIREEERTRIAREVHDELGQQLTGIKMDVSWVKKKIPESEEILQERIQSVMQMIDETVKTIRRISTELRPGMLDDLGLNAALDWQCTEFEKRTNIRCNFLGDLQEADIDRETATGFFRIFQESLTNVARHSEATEVNAVLFKLNDLLCLRISDNGKGFNVNEIQIKKTLGLMGMNERAKMINGVFEIKSLPGQGSVIELKAPFKLKILDAIHST